MDIGIYTLNVHKDVIVIEQNQKHPDNIPEPYNNDQFIYHLPKEGQEWNYIFDSESKVITNRFRELERA